MADGIKIKILGDSDHFEKTLISLRGKAEKAVNGVASTMKGMLASQLVTKGFTAMTGSINFRTGEVKSTRGDSTLYDIFEKNYRERNAGATDAEVKAYLEKILKKEAYDRAGLVYGMGHAVYTLSDPRCKLLKERAARLAKKNPNWEKEFRLYDTIERLTPECFYRLKNSKKYMCANVDMYSGFVYKMLGIAPELYTPIFAISRIPGWCAHRLEETIGCSRIIRPAYKSIVEDREYIPLSER